MKLLFALKLFNSLKNILGFICIFSLGLITGSIFSSNGAGPLAAALSEAAAGIITVKTSLLMILPIIFALLISSLLLKRIGFGIHLLSRISGKF
ncbi:MAG: hypothetical protein BWY32_03795 [bacterium ADurb.Bin243]|nr:MAG: hypothetical protein BWY32_03795 [bacterium ADurb.Bin243]